MNNGLTNEISASGCISRKLRIATFGVVALTMKVLFLGQMNQPAFKGSYSSITHCSFVQRWGYFFFLLILITLRVVVWRHSVATGLVHATLGCNPLSAITLLDDIGVVDINGGSGGN